MDSIGQRKQIKLVDQTPVLTGSDWEPGNTTILNAWANVSLKSSNRAVQYDQTLIGKFFEFRFRWVNDITLNANIRLVYNGGRYAIQSLERDNEKNFYWILTASAKAFE